MLNGFLPTSLLVWLSQWWRTCDQGDSLLVAEGQAEPWETVTIPPSVDHQGMYSCLPEQLIMNYNACLEWAEPEMLLYAYLFWGAEYWMLRKQSADSSYLRAVARILEQS